MKKRLAVAALDLALRVLLLLRGRWARPGLPPGGVHPHRILVCRPDHIGDAVLATPAVRALRRRFPEAVITFAVASWSAPLFDEFAPADEIFVIDPPWWIVKRGASGGVRAWLRAWRAFLSRLRELRQRRFDLCVELRGDVRQIVAFGWYVGAGHVIACRRNGGHFLADAWLPARADRHESLQDLDLVALAGCDGDDPVPDVAPGRAARDAVDALLRELGVGTVVVVVHPAAKRANAWPREHYRELLATLTEDARIRVLLTGAPSDAGLHGRLVEVRPERIRSIAGMPLPQVAALIARADLFIGADTGPMHLLNGTKTRAVLLFGPTKPVRFAPFGNRHRILEAGWCCSEELHDVCRLDPEASHGRCMASLGVGRVREAVAAALAASDDEREHGAVAATVSATTASPGRR